MSSVREKLEGTTGRLTEYVEIGTGYARSLPPK